MKKLCRLLLCSLLILLVLNSNTFAFISTNGDNLIQDSVSKLKLKFALYSQQSAWLHHFWNNVDMDQVDSDLKEMKRKGFNAVAIQVNVGDIISSINRTNLTYTENSKNKSKFQTFLQKAKNNGLYTIVWTSYARIPSGWGGEGVSGKQRDPYTDLLDTLYPAYYGYVTPGLQAAAYNNDTSQSTFRWTVFKEFHRILAQLSNNDPTVIWDPLDWQHLNINYWDYGGTETLNDWRAYLKKTNTSTNYWLGRWGETQTGSWESVLLPIDSHFSDYLNSPEVQPGDPILKYTGVPVTTNTNKWNDFRGYTNTGLNKMINDITGTIKTYAPNAVIGQRIDYWRYNDYRTPKWGTGQVDFIFQESYPLSDSEITNVYNEVTQRTADIRTRLTNAGRYKPIAIWETGVIYNNIYGLTKSKAYKEDKQKYVVEQELAAVENVNLAGLGYWTYRDQPIDLIQMTAINTLTGRAKPAQKSMTSIISKVNENAGFEKDTNSNTLPDLWETQWRNGTSTGAYALRTTASPLEGSYIYRLYNGTGHAPSIQFVLSDNIPVIASAQYQVNAGMRYTLSSGGTAYMSVIEYDKNNQIKKENHTSFDKGGWVWNDNYISFTTDANTSYIRIRFGVGGEQGAMLDIDRVRFISTGLHLSFEGSSDAIARTGEDGETPVDYNATSFSNGVIGKSIVINGSSARLTYPQKGNFDVSKGSLETWIMPYWNYDSSGSSPNRTVFYWAADSNNYFRLAIDGQKTLKAEWKRSGTTKVASYTITGWKSNVWHHIAATWNSSDGSIKLYTDGTIRQTITGWASPLGNSNLVYLGHKGGTQQLYGRIDEFHIYDYVRSANQILAESRAKPTFWLNFVSDRDGYDAEAPSSVSNVPLTANRHGAANSAGTFSSSSVLSYPAMGNFHVHAGTVQAWVKTSLPYDPNYSGADQHIFNWTHQAWKDDFKLYIWAQNRIVASWYTGGTLYSISSPISSWQANSWHHVAATWDKEKGTLKLYVDGMLIGTATSITLPEGWVDRIDIGSYLGQYDKWIGIIDDVRVYAYDRTDAEILKDYRGY